ncbi:multiple myeloma tumor-associated protein 2-like [Ornithodoros turicata]|uniref:Putative kinase phosphorylation protein n=1 Tax=Ornithodoros turicata TaxID=34597 RepID=A0A2R5L799_9ACAR
MYHPVRGGTRGGADQFNWDDVKEDKYRENYLGHSLKAPVGRWQKGKDLTWYAKEPGSGAGSKGEDKIAAARSAKAAQLQALKKAEEEAMLNALGFSSTKSTHHQLSKEEMNEALKRGESQRDEFDIERVAGVGTSRRHFSASSGGKVAKEGVSFVSLAERTDTSKRKHHQDRTESKTKKHKKKHKRSRSPS